MDPHRFRLATRIHFALLRQYGEDVDVAALLKGSAEGREALWVCEASNDRELVELVAGSSAWQRCRRARPRPSRLWKPRKTPSGLATPPASARPCLSDSTRLAKCRPRERC
jgi:hypothetical protein